MYGKYIQIDERKHNLIWKLNVAFGIPFAIFLKCMYKFSECKSIILFVK